MPEQEIIYLDNNATTPLDPRVLEAMMPYLTSQFGNASSQHKMGQTANDAVKLARNQISNLLNCDTNELIFTSGATEAINLAIKGVAEMYQDKGKHIVTVKTEHSAVLDVCKYLETKGYEVTYLPVLPDGLLDLEVVKSAIRTDTILVSVMMVNNETGVIHDIKEIAKLAHEKNALFMTDATQAVGKIEVDVNDLDIDLLAFSGHKIYGPKGVGALYLRQRRPRKVKLTPIIHGGGHERGFRSGTLNVPGIIGLGKACEIAKKEMKANEQKIRKLRDDLEVQLLQIKGSFINGNREKRLFNTINIAFSGVDSDALIMNLSEPEDPNFPIILISNGSACTSKSIEPSHVLIAMNLNHNIAFNNVRISIHKFNKSEEVNTFINALKRSLKTLLKFNYDQPNLSKLS